MRRPELPGPPSRPASRWGCRFATNRGSGLSRPRPRCGQRSRSSGARCSFRSPRSSGGRSACDGGDRGSPDMAQRESDDAARLLERLLADRTLRERFRRDPAGVSREAGLERVAQELRVRDGKALDTLDGRESRSSLAGVLMAAAIEGAGIFDFSHHVAGHVERVPEPVERVLASHRDHAGAGAGAGGGAPAASPAAALREPLQARGTTPAPPSAAGEFRAITPREAAAAAAEGPRPTGAAPEPVPIDVARDAPAGDGADPARLHAGLEHGPSDAPELPGDDEEAPDGASGGEEGPDDDGDGSDGSDGSDDGDDSDSDDASDDEEDDENEGGEAPDADDGSSGEADDGSDNPDGDHDDNSDATDGDNSDSDNSDSDSDSDSDNSDNNDSDNSDSDNSDNNDSDNSD